MKKNLLDGLAKLLLGIRSGSLAALLGRALGVLRVLIVGAKKRAHEAVLRKTERTDDVHGKCVSVLLEEAGGLVRDLAGVVVDGEDGRVALGSLVVLGVHRQVLVQLLNHRGIGGLRTLIIREKQHTDTHNTNTRK